MHALLLHNDQIIGAREQSVSAGQVGFLNGWGVFSTIRVANGVLFAFLRHWDRMKKDASRMRVPFPADPEWMRSRLLKLIEANRAHDATLRVAIIRNRGGLFEAPGQQREFDLIAFTADIVEWPKGVRLGLKPQARHAASEFAGAKIVSWAHNLAWYEEAHDRGLDEYVLLNERGEVCECTSANIFAVFGSKVSTPPLTCGCLAGITRAILLKDIQVPGITIGEHTLLPADLERADQVFITSTTRDLLPVVRIEGMHVNTSSMVAAQLQKAFVEYRQQDLGHETERLAAAQF